MEHHRIDALRPAPDRRLAERRGARERAGALVERSVAARRGDDFARLVRADRVVDHGEIADDDIEDAEDTIGDSSDVNKFSAAYEKETVINFNNAEQNASCYTLNTHKRQMLLNLAEEYPDDVKIISKRDDMVEVTFPKKWVKIRPPRKLTEEQRVNAVERGRALAALAAEKRAAKSNEIDNG